LGTKEVREMKIFFVLFYLLLFMGCNEENLINPTEDSTFGIYLLKDRAVSISKIRNISRALRVEREIGEVVRR